MGLFEMYVPYSANFWRSLISQTSQMLSHSQKYFNYKEPSSGNTFKVCIALLTPVSSSGRLCDSTMHCMVYQGCISTMCASPKIMRQLHQSI